VELGKVEAIPNVGIEIAALGLSVQQLVIDVGRDARVTIDGAAMECQFEDGNVIVVGRGF